MKILILGSTGWIGRAFQNIAWKAGLEVEVISRSEFWIDDAFKERQKGIDAVVNCAGFAGSPNVDQCELPELRNEVMTANVGIPMRLAKMCEKPLLHVSSGCVYQGKKNTGELREVLDYAEKEYKTEDWQKESWSEEDAPNYNGSVYSQSKILGEEALAEKADTWIYRPRMFFTTSADSKNFLTKICNYNTLVNAINSVTNLNEFCISMIKCLIQKPNFGIYHITHAEPIMTSMVMDLLGHQNRKYVTCRKFNQEMVEQNLAQRSFTTLDSRKAKKAGIGLSDNPMDIIRYYES